MDWSSEKNPWLSALLGFVLVFVWGVMSLAHAYNRSLTKVNDSLTRGFMAVEQLGAVLDALARLNVDQQAFLSTGEERFQDGVILNAERLELDMEVLNSLAGRSKLHRAALTGLSESIEQVLHAVGQSDEINDVRGRAAAVAFFESREAAISVANGHADQLRAEITGRLSDQIRSARGTYALFQDLLFGAPAGTALGHSAAFSSSARLPGHAAMSPDVWASATASLQSAGSIRP